MSASLCKLRQMRKAASSLSARVRRGAFSWLSNISLRASSGGIDLKRLILVSVLEAERPGRFRRARVPEVVTLARHLHECLTHSKHLLCLPINFQDDRAFEDIDEPWSWMEVRSGCRTWRNFGYPDLHLLALDIGQVRLEQVRALDWLLSTGNLAAEDVRGGHNDQCQAEYDGFRTHKTSLHSPRLLRDGSHWRLRRINEEGILWISAFGPTIRHRSNFVLPLRTVFVAP